MCGPKSSEPKQNEMSKTAEPQQPQGPSMTVQNTPPQNHDPVPEWLGDKLKEMFSNVMTEPVPQELVSLLQQLEEREKGGPH